MSRPGRQWFLALGLVLAGVPGWVAWTSLPVDPETQAVRVAAEGAIRTLYFDAAPPSSYAGGPLAPSDAAAIKARLSADIARYFTASLQARYMPMEFQFVDQIPTGDRHDGQWRVAEYESDCGSGCP